MLIIRDARLKSNFMFNPLQSRFLIIFSTLIRPRVRTKVFYLARAVSGTVGSGPKYVAEKRWGLESKGEKRAFAGSYNEVALNPGVIIWKENKIRHDLQYLKNKKYVLEKFKYNCLYSRNKRN